MKIYLTLIFLQFYFIALAQRGDQNILDISVSCGFGAYTSKEIQSLQDLNSSKDFKAIKSKLLEGTDIEAVLSVIILKEYYTNKLFELNALELSKIRQLEKSNEKFSFCYTCTYQKRGTLKQLFSNKNDFIYKLLKERLLKSN